MSVIEAMARGMPVLASHASAGVFKKSGLVVDRDSESLQSAMKQMIEGNLWREMANFGPAEAERYSLEKVIPLWKKLYDEVIR